MIPVFSTALVGLLVGAAGNAIMPSFDKGGRITSAILGVCGGSLVTSICWLQGWFAPGDPIGYATAVAGAVALLIVYRVIVGLRIAETE
jgi:uncharacterized membrane protein YeaQ/YmgE (transglycosylase-associated protein family)